MRVQTVPLSVRPAALDPLRALPADWDEWAEEPAYQVLVEEDGQVVGALHVAMVSATEAWLEGLRVRADCRGRGIGRRLVAEGEALAVRYGAAVARTAIPGHDYAAQAVAERAGYGAVARGLVLGVEAGAGPIDVPYEAAVRDAGVGDVAAVTGWLKRSETVRAWRGLVPLGWRFRTLVPELVKGLVRDRRVLRSGEARGGDVEGVACYALRRDAAVVSVLEGSRSHGQALLGTVADRALAHGASRLVLFAPDVRAVPAIRGEWQPHPWCPDGLVLVEKEL